MTADLHFATRPDEAPQPWLWKSLGRAGYAVEMFYHIDSWDEELDVDLEAELRAEMLGILPVLMRVEGFDYANTTFLRYARGGIPDKVVRFIVYDQWVWTIN